MSKKEEFFKERFKQALDSTYKVISEELHNLSKKEKYFESKSFSPTINQESTQLCFCPPWQTRYLFPISH